MARGPGPRHLSEQGQAAVAWKGCRLPEVRQRFGTRSTRQQLRRYHGIGCARASLGAAGANPVVWWDPSALRLDVQEEVGSRQERILVADEGGVAATGGLKHTNAGGEGREAAVVSGRIPSISVGIVTELSATNLERFGVDRLPSVAVQAIEADRRGRPAGRRFGLLVHAVLAAANLDAKAESLHSLAVARGRLLGATREEIDSAVSTAQAALAHPLMQRAATAARSGGLRREAPVLLACRTGRSPREWSISRFEN